MELLIMAAGMGSRFGGLKQIEPMGPNDEFLIDYSIYDAIKEGFSKVIFVIKEENYEIFKQTIGKRVENHIPVEYVFQKQESIPDFVKIPKERTKPWGTAHAIYCAKDVIKEPFIIINADDFYGRNAFKTAKEFLENKKDKEYATITYKVANTMTKNGAVKRGVIISENDYLQTIIECNINEENNKIIAQPLDGRKEFVISNDTLVSMNLLAFDLSIFPYLEEKIKEFFQKNANNLDSCEFLIPDVLDQANEEGYAKVKVLNTDAVWHGVTYKEDKENVKNSILKLIDDNEYPYDLWK